MLATALFTCVLATAHPPQSTEADLVEAIALGGDTFESGGLVYEADYFSRVVRGVGGGWTAFAGDRDATSGRVLGSILIGQLPGDRSREPKVLQVPPGQASEPQPFLVPMAMAGDDIAYYVVTTEQNNVLLGTSVWLNDQQVVQAGDPVAGTTDWTWHRFESATLAPNGRLIVEGLATTTQPTQPFLMVADVTNGTMLFNGWELFPTLSRRIESVSSDIAMSPDGQHWAAQVCLRNGGGCTILVDGAVHEIEPGFRCASLEAFPPSIAAQLGPGTWSGFRRGIAFDDSGQLTFVAGAWLESQTLAEVMVRGQNVIFTDATPLARPELRGVDRDGAVHRTDAEVEGGLVVEGYPVMSPLPRVDLDGDGVADPDQFFSFYASWNLRACEDGAVIAVGEVGPLGPLETRVSGIVRARSSRIERSVCDGAPNSTGRRGRMLAAGSPIAAGNECSLRIWNLPKSSRGYVLLSQTTSVPVQPNGSQGTICLGGAIGRLQSSLFLVGGSGLAEVGLDLTAIPQPMGTVAVMAGETWYAQAWHRDFAAGSSTSNFTDAIGIDFQ